MMGRIRAALLLTLVATPLLAADTAARIEVPNAEDLAPVASGRWVVASSMPGGALATGALYGVDGRGGAVHRLYPRASDATPASAAGCGAEVAPAAFSPHGIAAQRLASGGERLFVVNHGERESIELFDIGLSADEPSDGETGERLTLTWRGCVPLPAGAIGNAVAATPDGRLFVTNMGAPIDGGARARKWVGDVLEWSPQHGWQTLPDSEIYAINGLLVSARGDRLYATSWAGGEVVRLTRDDGGAVTRKAVSLPFLPDNLRWGRDGSILATGLRATPEQVVQCVMARGPCEQTIPTAVAVIDADALTSRCQLDLALHMGTAAVPVGDALWVGPVRGDSIRVLDGEAGRCH